MDQAAIAAIIDRLEYDFQQFELYHFIDQVERYQRRQIVLQGFPLELTLSAVWMRGDEVNYIVYNDRMHVVQQRHNILHEIAHIVLNHRRRPLEEVLPPELLAQLLLLAAQGRPRPTDPRLRVSPEEQEAEAFVLHIQQRLVKSAAAASPAGTEFLQCRTGSLGGQHGVRRVRLTGTVLRETLILSLWGCS